MTVTQRLFLYCLLAVLICILAGLADVHAQVCVPGQPCWRPAPPMTPIPQPASPQVIRGPAGPPGETPEIDYPRLCRMVIEAMAKDERFRGPTGPAGTPGRPGQDGKPGRDGQNATQLELDTLAGRLLEIILPKLAAELEYQVTFDRTSTGAENHGSRP